MKHRNNGNCEKCREIFSEYPLQTYFLFDWFVEFQLMFPELHISEAGRGRVKQAAYLERKASLAKYGESAHNYHAAIDTFVMLPEANTIYPRHWYYNILEPRLPAFLNWYGARGAKFPELPHIEIRNWKEMVNNGELKLVEE